MLTGNVDTEFLRKAVSGDPAKVAYEALDRRNLPRS
jgi:hypothetical protein